MDFKLVAIDCDGTLINSKSAVPLENKVAIQRLKKLGVEFIIITGRSDVHVFDYVKELGITAPVVGCNGASTRNLMDGTLFDLFYFEHATLVKLFDYFETNALRPKVFGLDNGYYCKPADFFDHAVLESTYSKLLTQNFTYMHIDKFDDLFGIGDKLIKMVIIEEDENKLLKTQKELMALGGLEAYRSAEDCLDIVCKDVSKGSALKRYADHLNITSAEIVAIGDSENDLEMLKYAGFAVAMGNAAESVKKIADYITATNDEAGVAKALNKIFEYKQ